MYASPPSIHHQAALAPPPNGVEGHLNSQMDRAGPSAVEAAAVATNGVTHSHRAVQEHQPNTLAARSPTTNTTESAPAQLAATHLFHIDEGIIICPHHMRAIPLAALTRVYGDSLPPMQRFLMEGSREQYALVVRPANGDLSTAGGCLCQLLGTG